METLEELARFHLQNEGYKESPLHLPPQKSPFKKTIPPPLYHVPESPSLEEHFEAFKANDKITDFHKMVPFEWTHEIHESKPFAVVNTADWQLGQHGVDYNIFQQDLETWINEPGLYVNLGGDGYQNIIQPAKMGSSFDQQPIASQRGAYVLILKRLLEAHKLIAMGTGNHNYWSAMLTGEDWDGELAHRLKAEYSKHCAVIHIKAGEQVYPILRMHKGRYNSGVNLTNSPKQHQRIQYPKARVICVEHLHEAACEGYYYDGKLCYAVRPGTYAVYDDYAQQNGYFGHRPANPTIVMYPDEDRIVGFLRMQDAIEYLRAARK